MGTTGLDVARNGDTARRECVRHGKAGGFHTAKPRILAGEETDSACEQRYIRPLFAAKVACNLPDQSELSGIGFVSFFCFR